MYCARLLVTLHPERKAPVVQWIEQRFPKPSIRVRFPAGVPSWNEEWDPLTPFRGNHKKMVDVDVNVDVEKKLSFTLTLTLKIRMIYRVKRLKWKFKNQKYNKHGD